MSTKHVVSSVAVTALAAGALAATSVPASAATAPVSAPRIVAHLDLAAGQQPENITLLPHGSVAVTFALSRQIAAIGPDGKVKVLATLPAPAAGSTTPVLSSPFLGGIVRAKDGTLYFNYATGTADLTGIWKLRPGGRPQRIAALPAKGLLNGLALDARSGHLYAADSVLGTIWRAPVKGGKATAWSTDKALAQQSFLGANGIKVRNGAVWATNLDAGAVLRIPVGRHGAAGHVRTVATGLPAADDLTFTGKGDTLLVALNSTNEVALVRPNGSHTTVLTAKDGLEGPTSLAIRGDRILVPSAAYFTQKDPNLLGAKFAGK
ncbi:hypothetical protein AB0M32_10590 [Streptomyces sp. NPDC051985]|uniref:SMP-30/gluconolactonase/LRE family protein n=1 Tax=Streptomyces sp. NPDC051985 TaxID=3155807 RepID=UPI00342C3D68